MTIIPVRRAIAAGIALVSVSVTTIAMAQPPHADVPLDPVEFSIDMLSPSLAGGFITEADVLKKPGPVPIAPSIGLGITAMDELDGLSADEGELLPGDPFVIIFSVSRGSVGLTPPDPALVLVNRPFNVLNQAALGQAPGDIFMTTRGFDAGGIIPDPGRLFSANNTLVINQGDTGGVDMDLKPEKAPVKDETSGGPKDAVDAVSKASSSSGGARSAAPRGPTGGPGDPFDVGPLFFSLRRNSPSLVNLPGIPSGSNIYFDAQPLQPGMEQLFLSGNQLGLQGTPGGDDISGFTVFAGITGFAGLSARGIGITVLFTLAPGSPSLGPTFSPADIFISGGGGTFARFASAAELGLAPTDAVTGFTIIKSTIVDDLVLDSAIQRRIPGDFDENGILDSLDCDELRACYSGSGTSYDTNGVATHNVDVGPGATFSPAVSAIETGDTVMWTWVDGPHNIVSGSLPVADGAFSSGPPTIAPATFSVVFDPFFLNAFPKTSYPYFSEPDGAAGLVGEIVVVAHPCATFDMDFDGDVDCDDWREFRDLYIQLNGTICLPLTIEEFVAVLLCSPLDPSHNCFADMNDDDMNDGRDIHLFVTALLIGP